MTSPAKILLVDDEPLMRIPLHDRLERAGYQVVSVGSAEEAERELAAEDFDVAVVDLRLPKRSGLDLLKQMRELGCQADALVITAHGTIEAAVAAMKLGARDFLTKPFETEALLDLVARYVRVRRAKYDAPSGAAQAVTSFSGMVGASPAMLEVYRLIETVAESKGTVIIQGETGTGKELAANAIHARSPRRGNPFVKLNCASIPEPLFESELFGFERGAFTGADHRQKGKLEVASTGTLLMDEVDEMPLTPQAKLLRALQEQEIVRLGGLGPIRVDVRILATTKVDLAERVAEGRFREDLFYRLNVLPIVLPPLRERGDDVVLLAEHFLRELCAESRRPPRAFSPEAITALRAHAWPGNVRELRNVVARAVTLSSSETIPPAALGLPRDVAPPREAPSVSTLAAARVELEDQRIQQALAETGGHKGRAAELLGISRKTLWEKLNRRPR